MDFNIYYVQSFTVLSDFIFFSNFKVSLVFSVFTRVLGTIFQDILMFRLPLKWTFNFYVHINFKKFIFTLQGFHRMKIKSEKLRIIVIIMLKSWYPNWSIPYVAHFMGIPIHSSYCKCTRYCRCQKMFLQPTLIICM